MGKDPYDIVAPAFELEKRNAVKRHYDMETDSSAPTSPEATNEHDLPGYRPHAKRRKLFDNRLIYATSGGGPSDVSGETIDRVKTPAKTITCPTGSATKTPGIPVGLFSDTIMNLDFHNIIAENINNAIDKRDSLTEQLDGVLPTILTNTEQYPTFEEIVSYAVENTNNQFGFEQFDTNSIQSTSTPSKGSGTDDLPDEQVVDRQLTTPVPAMNESIKQRLRPRKQEAPLNVKMRAETKRKSKSKEIQIISNEYIGRLPETTTQTSNDIIIVNSDSEGTVTTTSAQPLQIAQPTYFLKLVDPNTQTFHVEMPSQSTNGQLQTFANNLNLPIVFESNPYSMPTIMIDPQNIVNSNEFPSNQLMLNANQQGIIDESQHRIIIIDDNNMNIGEPDGTKPEEMPNTIEIPTEKIEEPPTKPSEPELTAATPKEQIKSNLPTSSKSLSTPRRRNPHVRVLDFTTPARLQLSDIAELKSESTCFNASKLFAITPQNHSITSSIPSSAPAKMSAVVDTAVKSRITKTIEPIVEESSSVDTVIPFSRENDEDTVVSVGSDTPKVRKKSRRSCVRTLSSHKELNTVENEKRFKRVAKTKKKICDGSENSNEDEKSEESTESKKADEPKIDPSLEWEMLKKMKNDPKLFEQHLRESESKKQTLTTVNGPNKRRTRRAQKKAPAKTKKPAVAKTTAKKSAEKSEEKSEEKSAEKSTENSNKSTDVSFNSSMNTTLNTTLNSTQLRLEAQMLEDNLSSAKKSTPIKHITAKQLKKKKTPNKVHIKLMPSPKIKSKKTPKKETKIDKQVTDVKQSEIETELITNQPAIELMSVDSTLSNKSTHEDLQAANDLINMKDFILQQEKGKQIVEQCVDDQPSILPAPSTKTITESITLTQSTSIPSTSLSMLSLETPFKNEIATTMFPRTPGVNQLLSQLTTPMIKSSATNILDVSIFKNPQFPTPSFPLTPGSIFTPLKDLNSPREDGVVYGAANRPTDYSSSSSYYKPDESDGIDKQIQASVRSTRSSVYSADELEFSRKENDVGSDAIFNDESSSKLNSSTSSSSSSDDSDSDSDSSSTSFDSNASQTSRKSTQNVATEEIAAEDGSLSTIIKSHLVSASDIGIAQNILLTEPEPSAVDKEAEKAGTLALMETKRLRIQDKLRQLETKKSGKNVKQKQTVKSRLLPAKRNERFRLPTVAAVRSPSKRKSTLPQKLVARQTIAQTETQSIITQQVISEAISDNAIVDASDVKKDEKISSDSENIDAIAEHIRQTSNDDVIDQAVPTKEEAIKMSKERLVGILEGKQSEIRKKCDQQKMVVINALPMKKITRSRSKLIITPANMPKKAENQDEVKIKLPSTAATVTKPIETIPEQSLPSTSNPKNDLKTPAKDRKHQLHDLFGDVTDIETPIKSSPKKSFASNTVEIETKKTNVDSSTANTSLSSLSTDEYTSDEDELEMVFSIDENDKKRFRCIRETPNIKATNKPQISQTNLKNFKKTVVIDENEKVVLTIESEEEEFYSQNLESVIEMKEKQRRKSSTTIIESKLDYGKPLSTSTPSPSKQSSPLSPKPKINIKHKIKDTKGQERYVFFNSIENVQKIIYDLFKFQRFIE